MFKLHNWTQNLSAEMTSWGFGGFDDLGCSAGRFWLCCPIMLHCVQMFSATVRLGGKKPPCPWRSVGPTDTRTL